MFVSNRLTNDSTGKVFVGDRLSGQALSTGFGTRQFEQHRPWLPRDKVLKKVNT